VPTGGAANTGLIKNTATNFDTSWQPVAMLASPCTFTAGPQTFQPAAGQVGLVVQAAASQTAHLQDWVDGTGTVRTWVGATGYLGGSGIYLTGLNASNISSGTLGSAYLPANVAYTNVANVFTVGPQTINANADTTVPLIVKANSPTQTANLIEWWDSTGTVLLGQVTSQGYVNAGNWYTTPAGALQGNPQPPADVATTPAPHAAYGIVVNTAAGGNTTIATTGAGGQGSVVSLQGGPGGQAPNALVASAGGQGGNESFTAGTGGAANVAGTGNNTGGQGGVIVGNGGAGGAATGATSGTNTGGGGGYVNFQGGTGGAATTGTGALNGGPGGAAYLTGGTGGVGTVPGAGGTAYVRGGVAAAAAGGAGGVIQITAGLGSTTGSGGTGGSVTIKGGNAGGDQTVARTGGLVQLVGGNSVGAAGGGAIQVTSGTGGIGPATTGQLGGAMNLTCGAGGANATGGNGGLLTLTGGAGGAGTTTNGNGGSISLVAGAVGGGAGTGGISGGINLKPGAPGATGTAGAITLQNSAGTNVIVTNDTGLGFYGTGGVAKQTVTGQALAIVPSLVTALKTIGLITDGTTTGGTINLAYTNVANVFTLGPQTLQTGAAANKGLIVQAAASQTANLEEWQDSTATMLSCIGPLGHLGVGQQTIPQTMLSVGQGAGISSLVDLNTTNDAPYHMRFYNAAYGAGSVATVAAQSTSNLAVTTQGATSAMILTTTGTAIFTLGGTATGAAVKLSGFTASTVGMMTYGAAGQTGDFQQWRNSAGTILARVDSSGTIWGERRATVATWPAAGTTQGTATPITTEITLVSSGTGGVALRTAQVGMVAVVINTSGAAVNVYPAVGAQINALGLNNPLAVATGSVTNFYATSTSQWYSK
jgi:hypothetical protein